MATSFDQKKPLSLSIQLCLLVLGCLMLIAPTGTSGRASAQTQDGNPTSVPEKQSKTALSSSLSARDEFLKLKSELVVLSISVTDSIGRLAPGLKQEEFQIQEDDVPQSIRFFSTEDIPITVGIILDISGSMRSKVMRAREAVRQFVQWSNPQDEFFAIAFNRNVVLLADFTDGEVLLSYIPFLQAKGRTAMYDAVYEGVLKLKQAHYGKRVLLVISDGQDNSSRHGFRALKRLMQESDVQIYTIGTPDPTQYDDYFERMGISILQQISKLAGGRHFTVMGASALEPVCASIARELRQQYTIGYMSSNTSRDGKWRELKVRVQKGKGQKFRVNYKRGYYALLEQP